MQNDKYWSQRLANKAYDNNSEGMIKELVKIYKRQGQDLKNKITELYELLWSNGEISTTNLYAYGRYNDLLKEINKILTKYGQQEITVITAGLEQAYKEVFEETSDTLGKEVKWSLQNKEIMQEVVNANFKGANFSTRIWNNKSKLEKTLAKKIQDIVAAGLNKDEAVKAIMKSNNVSFSNADRLVRTETMRVINSGQKQSFTNAGYTKGYYLVAEDDRLCEECKEWERKTKSEPMNLEDMDSVHHPRCRCTIIPVVESLLKPLEMIDITNENMIQSKITEYENAIQSKGIEYAYCILTNGEVYKFKGDKYSVSPLELKDKLKDAIITHNHPASTTNYSFSGDDLGLFLEYGLKTLNGIDNKYKYTITRTKDTVNAKFDDIVHIFSSEIYLEALQYIFDNGLDVDEDIYHISTKLIAERFKFEYRRFKI